MKAILGLFGIIALSGATAGLIASVAAQEPPSDPARLEERRLEAERLPLFARSEPLAFTLTADFKAVQGDRNPESTTTFPATIEFAGPDGAPMAVDLKIRTRGHARRSFNVCDFAPLRLDFDKGKMKGTVFEGQNAIKLGVHCREGVKVFEQYVLREYAAYRIYQLITPASFRVRLARATYVDAVKQQPISTRYAMFIEDDEDVAKRMDGRITEERDHLARLDRDAFTRMALFEYMIGNVDMSVIAFHNVKAVRAPSGTVYPVPYDFDYSGLVDASYAIPPQGLGITTVRSRVFRGPCRTEEDLAVQLQPFQAIRSDLAAVYDSLPDLFDARAKKRALGYLEGFYKTIAKPRDLKKAFMDRCLKRGLM